MWMSGSLCLIHPPYSIRFCPPHLILFISWVLQLLNQFYSYTTLHLMWMERFGAPFSSTWQHQLSTSVLLDVPYLEPVPFMDSVFLLTLWMPDSVQKAVWMFVLMFFVFFFTLRIMLSLQNTDYLTIITSQSQRVIHSPTLLSPPPSFPLHLLPQVMETKNMLYLVTEYAKNGEIFGEWPCCVRSGRPICPFECGMVLGKQGSIKVLLDLLFAASLIWLNLKSHMTPEHLRTLTWFGTSCDPPLSFW